MPVNTPILPAYSTLLEETIKSFGFSRLAKCYVIYFQYYYTYVVEN